MAREQRRLSAIVAADVVGYSRLMGRDESGTLARLRRYRAELIDPAIGAHGGRIVKTMGDGLLMEFPSVVDATRCAIELQQAMAARSTEVEEGERIVLRIGINLGDVIIDGDDIHGDGVNIAARLQAIALPGGVCVSSRVYEDVRDRLNVVFEDGGTQALKNIARPIQVWHWLSGASPSSGLSTPQQPPMNEPLALPDKPSIAVLPFQNMSGDPEQEFFTDGITEDITTELSRFHSLFVIARNSSFSYKNRSPDIRQVGRELGVRYVLEGSIRKAANRIRVTGQLVDTLTGNHVWAERYDRVLDDIFAVQEEVTKAIVAAITPQIDSTEQAKAARRRPYSLTAYEVALRARAHAREGTDKADQGLLDQSISEAEEALAIDPDSVLALQVLAYAHGLAVFYQMAADRKQAIRKAASAAARAIELDAADPLGYALRGYISSLSLQLDRYPDALADVRRAYEMNPNDTEVLRMLGNLEAVAGDPLRAIEHLHQFMRLNPHDTRAHITCNMLAFASFGARQYADGIRWALRALNEMPGLVQPYMNLAGCHVGMGEVGKAKAAFETGQRLSPEFFKTRLEGTSAYSRPEDRLRQLTFLRIAAGLEDPGAADALR